MKAATKKKFSEQQNSHGVKNNLKAEMAEIAQDEVQVKSQHVKWLRTSCPHPATFQSPGKIPGKLLGEVEMLQSIWWLLQDLLLAGGVTSGSRVKPHIPLCWHSSILGNPPALLSWHAGNVIPKILLPRGVWRL